MFEFNTTEIIQNISNFQNVDLNYILPNLLSLTYFELLAFTFGMFLYSMFVLYFYKKLAKRDIFELNLEKYDFPEVKWKTLKKMGDTFAYILKYGIVFPFYIGFWFTVLSIFMFLLAKNLTVRNIALISVSLVSTVRVTSYFREELSTDLAKMMPFALLGIFLVDPSFFSWGLFMNRLKTIPSLGWEIPQFFIFSILLEWTLRIFYSIKVVGSRKISSREVSESTGVKV